MFGKTMHQLHHRALVKAMKRKIYV